jgi:Sulfatase-modifying factor enzyme 1
MSSSRAVLSIALNFVGLSAAVAQQPAQSAAAAASVFQGLMVDARGMIVGRVVSESDYGAATLVVRQISGIWVALRVGDFTTGIGNGGDDTLTYWYQSSDCADQAYLPLNPAGLAYVTGPVFGTVAIPRDASDGSRAPEVHPGFDTTGSHPVVCISWHEAQAYTAWLRRRTGKQYQLPTEAEWEYAARADTQTSYSFGNDETELCTSARFADLGSRFGWRGGCRSDTATYGPIPVGKLRPNPWGIFGMHGK